ncbi:3'-5' exonuclease [Ceratobasidium sp. AG-Ba]|nr:3'-5' exonuclease [Ceratobasidium sp. AG-Ba]
MEALRRGASLAQEQVAAGEGSRQLSTIASMTIGIASTTPLPVSAPLPPSPSPVPSPALSTEAPRLAPTGLPFYTHTESVQSSGLPPIPRSNVHYFRSSRDNPGAPDNVNMAITRMINNLQSPPGSRWQGVVGFDMEWTVPYSKGRIKTGLIQLSDEKDILLIQISSMKYMPIKLKAIITSPTILKVGVNIGNDMRRLYQEFGLDYAGRGILDLSNLARVADVGLVGTRVGDMDSNRAHVGIGIKKDQALASTSSVDDILDAENDLEKEDSIPGDESMMIAEKLTSTISRGVDPADKLVRNGRTPIQLARLCRRYLQRELEKGDERTSNWDIKLSKEQCQYAANDVHSGLALYHALRTIHTQSVPAGLIPVPAPPPWEKDVASTKNSAEPLSSSTKLPASPPFRAKTVPAKGAPRPEIALVPVEQLQDLTPAQVESLLPWSTLVSDLRADMDAARAAVQNKRAKEGVDIRGKGEAVVEAEAAAKAAATSKSPTASAPIEPLEESMPSSVSTPLKSASSSSLTKVALEDNYATTPSKVLGKKWPPTRVIAPRIVQASSSSSISTSEVRPSSPGSHSTTSAKLSPVQLRVYLLWHNGKLSLPQICAKVGSNKAPLEKYTAICHILETLQQDPSLPYDAIKLKSLIDGDDRAKEEYRVFLEGRIGPLD